MATHLSPRLAAVVDALPLTAGMRVLEIGCGPGAAAREIARRIGGGYVLGLDRSATAIAQAVAGSRDEMASGSLGFRVGRVEEFQLGPGEEPYDIALAVRVGALDGRHPRLEQEALRRIAGALRKGGRLFLDGGNPLREVCVGAT